MVSSITKPLHIKRSVICSLQSIVLKSENMFIFSSEACLKTVNVMIQDVVKLLHCYRGKEVVFSQSLALHEPRVWRKPWNLGEVKEGSLMKE